MKKDVLIVGAGPTGMVAALQLYRFGIPFRIIDQRVVKGSNSKALSINPASLDILTDLGITNSLLEKGKKNEIINLVYNDKRLFKLDLKKLKSKFPYFLMLPQPDTELSLESQLNKLGCPVEYGTELLSLQQVEEGVEVNLKSKNGKETDFYRYVIGCDGIKSKTRNQMSLPFEGYDYDIHFMLADVKLSWDRDLTESFYYIKDDGFIIVLPLKDGYHRIVISTNGVIPKKNKITLDDFRKAIKNLDADINISDPIWMSSAPFYNRTTPTYRSGNIFIAGDASHSFSPIGGFGMNTGIGDAFNLGWRIGYVLNGIGTDKLLDYYTEERHWNSEQLLNITDLNTSIIARLDRHNRIDEEKFLPKFKNRKFIKEFPEFSAGYKLNYSNSIIEPRSKYNIGSLLSTIGFKSNSNNFVVGMGKHSLIINLDTPTNKLQGLQAILKENLGQLVRINKIKDPSYNMLEEGQFILVRPDFIIEYISTTENIYDFEEYLHRLYQEKVKVA